ncbi:inovirus Gp2 family protein [Salmonella enterica subsp. enterica serovar Sandiego]|uniref:Inovirus Gp2 family protein n=1 Tax=Salmonella enterica TaxID=28901 RepID=A0A743IX58_SALER|nr:inovirus Gp2 family protein [Salmonella enterica]EAA5994100.1 inovirus Gp2 family protein [Salmonella enterica subsp. enterica serovar Chester]EBV9367956.1 inovirus Gp2 family protein [Salmonella enterica subsp. enterica serovar Sandiego]EDQ9820766.1 inovirus Gp2 family protein [Salmonella enterica subsp. enterica]EAO4083985.1 inovirus Gp2 family protein [Salmonella enterica]EAT8236842.1 inovirus Gp2 family protein [Salmonella enterica]
MFLFDDIIHPMVVNQNYKPFNDIYLNRIGGVICNALQEHPRTTVIRVDLHLPDCGDVGDSIASEADLSQGLMSRFIDSLKAQLVAYRHQKAREGKRCHRSSVRYVWVLEWPLPDGKKHYHLALLVNTDTFNILGSYDEQGKGLASLIQNAWLSAMRVRDWSEYLTLVHFADNPLAYLDLNKLDFRKKLDALTFRLSYMAKQRTKRYSSTERSFGCSQG